MTIIVANTSNTNTFEYLINRVNELADSMTNYTVTTESNTAVGNSSITGSFSANVVNIGNTSANIVIRAPNSVQVANGNYFLNANGSYGTVNTSVVQLTSFTTTGISEQTVDSFSTTDYHGAKYLIHIGDLTANGHQASEVLTVHNGNTAAVPNAYVTEYAIITSNGVLGSFSASSNGTHVSLKITPTVTSANVSFSRSLF